MLEKILHSSNELAKIEAAESSKGPFCYPQQLPITKFSLRGKVWCTAESILVLLMFYLAFSVEWTFEQN